MANQITLTIGDKSYPGRLSLGAMLQYKRLTGKEISEMDGTSVSDLATVIYCCVASACRTDGIEFPYSLEEFCDRIYPEDLEKAVPMLQGDAKEDSKKKQRR